MMEKVQQPYKDEIDKEEYIVRKKLPKRLPKRKNDVYVTRRTDFKAQLARCQKMLDSDCHVIYIHGLGAATNRAVNLALQLKERSLGTIDVAVNTSTVELVDDLEPQVDHLEPQTQIRNNSAIHIKVFRPMPSLDGVAGPKTTGLGTVDNAAPLNGAKTDS